MEHSLSRMELLLGTETVQRIQSKHVIIFGIGGVGSWCAEALMRSGICHLTLVDSDLVNPSNINRQLMATTFTVGQSKVEALRDRLLSINPEAFIETRHERFDTDTATSFDFSKFDYIIDAIDSIDCKMLLIQLACQSKATLFSSMGAALKMDATRINVAEFWKVKGCPLGAALRHRFRKSHLIPARKFLCVYSEELLRNHSVSHNNSEESANGSAVHITGSFGFTLAGLVIQHIAKEETQDKSDEPSCSS